MFNSRNKTKDLSDDEAERFTFEIVQWSDDAKVFRVVGGKLCCIQRLLGTWDVLYGIQQYMYQGRYCFETLLDAATFLQEWDGKQLPTIGEYGCNAIK